MVILKIKPIFLHFRAYIFVVCICFIFLYVFTITNKFINQINTSRNPFQSETLNLFKYFNLQHNTFNSLTGLSYREYECDNQKIPSWIYTSFIYSWITSLFFTLPIKVILDHCSLPSLMLLDICPTLYALFFRAVSFSPILFSPFTILGCSKRGLPLVNSFRLI